MSLEFRFQLTGESTATILWDNISCGIPCSCSERQENLGPHRLIENDTKNKKITSNYYLYVLSFGLRIRSLDLKGEIDLWLQFWDWSKGIELDAKVVLEIFLVQALSLLIVLFTQLCSLTQTWIGQNEEVGFCCVFGTFMFFINDFIKLRYIWHVCLILCTLYLLSV